MIDQNLLPLPHDPEPEVDDTAEVRSVIDNLQSLITFVVALGAVLTGGGFVVVNSYIARYGWIQTHSVISSQYLAAGIGLVVFALVALIAIGSVGVVVLRVHKLLRRTPADSFPFVTTALIFFAIGIVLAMMSANLDLFFRDYDPIYNLSNVFIIIGTLSFAALTVRDTLRRIAKRVENDRLEGLINTLIGVTSLLAYIVIVGTLYGSEVHSLIPRSLGGGQAFPVQVSVSVPQTLSGVGIVLDELGLSEPLCFLVDVNNGIMVYSPPQHRIFAITAEGSYLSYRTVDPALGVNCLPPNSAGEVVRE